tara:strand:+ start:12306 stop:12830 length:525 start_codon:yes stop_codon:yes gene_type:complete
MSVNEKNVIDFKVVPKNEEAPVFSSGLYSWMMFLINFYNRIKKNLNIDFESFMIMQIVVSDYLYFSNKSGVKNYEDIKKELNNNEEPFFKNRKINIASISEVLSLPRETVRRKVLHLSKIKLLDYKKNGVSIGSEYKTVFGEFVSETVDKMSQLMKKWEADGSLKKLLELKKKI